MELYYTFPYFLSRLFHRNDLLFPQRRGKKRIFQNTSFSHDTCNILCPFFQCHKQVRAAIAKSISVYMSLRGHHDWADRRQSYFSNNYPTAAETEQASPRQVAIDDANNRSVSDTELILYFFRMKCACRSKKKKEKLITSYNLITFLQF